MERYTMWLNGKGAGLPGKDCFTRLAKYEDIGMKPEEVRRLQQDWTGLIMTLTEMGGMPHLCELVQAENDGRLVVLPGKVGDTVFVIGKSHVVECYIDEAYLDDTKGVEYLVSFQCNEDCGGCPFNDWHQDFTGEYSCSGGEGEVSIKGVDFGKTVFITREEAEAALKGAHDAES